MHNTPVDNELLDFLTVLNDAPSTDKVWGSTVAFMRGLGASHLHISMELDRVRPILLWTSPSWVSEQYLDEIYPDYDPTLEYCREKVTPLFTGAAFMDRQTDFPRSFRRFLWDLTVADVRSTVQIPIHTGSKRDWGRFSFHTDSGANEFNRLYARHGATIQLAGTMAFNQIRALHRKDRVSDIHLTAAERECLLWLSRGLRKDEIADRLDMRSAAVALHLASTRRKLDARTLDQALVNAVQLGLIEP